MAIKWAIGLLLVAVGFFFGKYLGAVTLPIMYYYALQALKKENQQAPQQQVDIEWACQTLAVPPTISKSVLKKKRRQLINQYHPDKLPADASDYERSQANARIDAINRAYEVLTSKNHEP